MAIVAPERIERLEKALLHLQQAGLGHLKPKERQFFLSGFCLGKYEEDIIFQMCFTYGRDIKEQLENFLKAQADERNQAV